MGELIEKGKKGKKKKKVQAFVGQSYVFP